EAVSEVKAQARDIGAVRVIHEVVGANCRLAGPGSGNPTRLNEAFASAKKVAVHDCLVVLISDADGADAETRALVTQLTEHNDVVVAYIHDPLESKLPDVGRAIFASGESQLEFDTSAVGLAKRFADEHAAWRSRLSAFSIEREIPVLPVSTDT